MGWVFAFIYGGMVAWIVHLASGREPAYPALPDIAVGALAGVLGFWFFSIRLGLHEAGAIGTASIVGWLWAAASALVASSMLAVVGRMRRRAG